MTKFLDFVVHSPVILVNNLKSASKWVVDTLCWVSYLIIAFSNEIIGGPLRYSQIIRRNFLKFGPLEEITCKLWTGLYYTPQVLLYEYCLKLFVQVFNAIKLLKIYAILYPDSVTPTLRGLKYSLTILVKKTTAM